VTTIAPGDVRREADRPGGDEHQHQQRTYGCEKARMINISQSFGGTPVIFIRWNPDTFKIRGRTQKVSKNKRLEILRSWINHFKKSGYVPGAFLSVIYLYYDDWSGALDVLLPWHVHSE
jgi:hypothetical protein